MANNDRAAFFRSFYDAGRCLPDDMRLRFYDALFAYAFDGEEAGDDPVVKALMATVKPIFDKSKAISQTRSVIGKSGIAKRWEGSGLLSSADSKPIANDSKPIANDSKPIANDSKPIANDSGVGVGVGVGDNFKKSEISMSFFDENDAQSACKKRRFDPKPFIDHYNAECDRLGSRLPRAKGKPAGRRLEMLRARVAEYGEDAVMQALTKAAASPFLNGGGPTGWKATGIDWILRPNNFPKVYEGGYDSLERPNIGLGNSRQTGYEVGRILQDNDLTKYDQDEAKWNR